MSNGITNPFRVGSVLGRGFRILFRNFITFGLVALIVLMPYVLVLSTISELFTANFSSTSVVILASVILLLPILLAYLATAAIAHGAFEALRGQRPSIARCLLRGFSLSVPVFGVAIVTVLALVLSMVPSALAAIYLKGGFAVLMFLVLLFPLFLVITVLWVAVPVVVIERRGILHGLSRSIALTKGNRWRAFGIIMILWLINWVTNLVGGLLLLPFTFAGGGSVAGLIMTGVLVSIYLALNAVMSTVGYHDLRVAKEGFAIDDIAAVFD
ncbi:MAG: hypothetical protein O7I42_02430 [Alphaproteobacteria bacterium]|nr:hypothetical protein [Alphaproteobacteria bacterium]